jgi:DNA-binding transcriptional LysR family regulator
MSSPFSSLDLIPSFHAVMTTGSLSAAARQLRLSQPTVRRHIEALEAELRTQLFTRAANGLTPTDMAHAMMPAAGAVLSEAAALARAASGTADGLEGVVRITCSRVLATHVMPHVLGEISAAAPDLQFELVGSDSTEDLLRRAVDIAVRFVAPTQQALVAQAMPGVAVGLFAAADLGAEGALADMPFIADDRENVILPAMAAAGMEPMRNVVLRVDDPVAQIAHIAAGLGVGLCQVRTAQRLGLRRVFPAFTHVMPCWLLMHEDQSRIRRIRHVFDRLKARLPELM